MADIGELVVRIKADAAQLERELKKASDTTKKNTKEMEGAFGSLKDQLRELIPAVTLAALVEFGGRSIEATSHLGDLAQRIGFAASTLSALESPLKTAGSDLDEFAGAMARLNNMLGEAAKGNQEAIKAFDDLGLSVNKLLALDQEHRFYAVANALVKYSDTSKQTEAAMNLMGRSAAALLPFLNEHKEGVEKAVQAQKDMKNALSDETVERIKQFGDALEDAGIRAKNSFIQAFAEILKVTDYISAHIASAEEMSAARLANYGITDPKQLKSPAELYAQKAKAGGFATEATFLKPESEARGDNKGLLKDPAAEAAAKSSAALKDYIENLQAEAEALSVGKEKLALYRAEKAAASAAGKKISDLTEEQIAQIDSATLAIMRQEKAYAELEKAEQKHIQMVAQMEAEISSSLADIIVNYENMGATVGNVLKQIAKQIIESQITTPLVSNIGSALGAGKGPGGFLSGFTSLLGFADGGEPPVGVPSMVGERGPELFVPKQAGTIVPNGALGGTSVVVNQTFQISPGVPELVTAKIREAAPFIADAARSAVFADMERGGKASRIVGKRS